MGQTTSHLNPLGPSIDVLKTSGIVRKKSRRPPNWMVHNQIGHSMIIDWGVSIFKQSHLGHTQSTLGHTQSRLGHTQSTLGHTDFRSKSHGIRFQSIWDGDPGDQAATLTRGLSSVKKVIEPGDQAASPNMYSCVGSSGSFRNLSDP